MSFRLLASRYRQYHPSFTWQLKAYSTMPSLQSTSSRQWASLTQLCNSFPKSKDFCGELSFDQRPNLLAQLFFPASESAEGSGAAPSFRVGGPWQGYDRESKGCDELAPKGIASSVQPLNHSAWSHIQVRLGMSCSKPRTLCPHHRRVARGCNGGLRGPGGTPAQRLADPQELNICIHEVY